MSRRAAIVSGVLATLLGLFVLSVVAVLYSPRVATWVAAQLPAWSDGQISVASVEGRLAGPLRVHGLTLTRDDGSRIDVDAIDLDWRPSRLWLSRVDVQQLSVRGVRVSLPARENAPSGEPLSLPDISLPGQIRIAGLEVREGQLLIGGEATAELQRLAADISIRRSDLEIQELQLDTPDFELRGKARVHMAGDWPLDVTLDWHVPAMPGGALHTRSKLSGDLARLRLRQTVSAPFTGELRASMEDVLEARRWQARVALEGLHLPLPQAGEAVMDFRAQGRGSGPEGRLTGEGGLHVAELDAPLLLNVELAFSQQRLEIGSLRASPAGEDGFVEARGHVDMAADDAPAGELALEWRDLRWPGLTPWAAVAGEATLSGSLAQYSVVLDGAIAVPDSRGGTRTVAATGRASGGREHIAVQQLRLETDGGSLEGEGSAGWGDALVWDVRARLRDMDPALLVADWPGRVSVDATSSGEGLAHFTAGFSNLHGELRGRALDGQGRFQRDGTDMAVDGLELSAGDARLAFDGERAQQSRARLSLRVPDLSWLLADTHGSLEVNATAEGPREQPLVRFRGRGRELSRDRYRIEAVDFSGALDVADEQASRLDLTGRGWWFDEREVHELALEVAGFQREHSIELMLSNEQSRLDMALAGSAGFEPPAWTGTVTALTVDMPEDRRWQLEREAVALQAGRDSGVSLDRLCLAGGASGRLCAEGSYDPAGAWQAALRLTALNLAELQPLTGAGLEIRGVVDAGLRASGTAGVIEQILLELDSVEGELVDVATIEGLPEDQLLRYRDAALRASVDDQGLKAHLSAAVGERGQLDFEARAADWDRQLASLQSTPLQARLRARTGELEVLALLVPQIDRLGGELDMDMTVSGTLEAPRMDGYVRVADGHADILPGELRLEAVEIEARAHGGRSLDLVASARSGGGDISAGGDLDWGRETPRLRLEVTGTAFQVANTAEVRVWVSPELRLVLKQQSLDLEGEIRVPRARLRPVDIKTTVRPSDDLVLVGTRSGEQDAGPEVSARVRVILGEAVDFSGFGLQGRLLGNLLVVERPGEVTTASGNLEIVDGLYEAYGQNLQIDPGRLVFTGGPLVDPGLDIRAQRRVRGVRVGLNVRGTLREPQVSMFSEPPMTQQDTLSYLLLGRPISQTSGEDGALLAQAALAIGLSGGESLAQSIGGRLGIDDVGIESESGTEQAQLVLGTYLSPRLYVSYGIGLFDAGNSARMRYTLTEEWTLYTESGAAASSADVIYTIER